MRVEQWTPCDHRIPTPMEFVDPDDGDPTFFTSRRVLLCYGDGLMAIGTAILRGPWEARVDGDAMDYIGHAGAVTVWGSDDEAVHGKEPTYWQDLPPPPNVTGLAIVARSLRDDAE